MKIVLGSGSPRRKDLLKEMGYDFRIEVPTIAEIIQTEWPLNKVAENLALLKGISLIEHIKKDEILICADTIVLHNSNILGKPSNKKEALEMLLNLSGNSHEVITGVAIMNKNRKIVFSETTKVEIKPLEEKDIIHYIDTFNPFDKAGSYGIQEWIGFIGVSKIIGSYTNVVGLPTARLHSELKGFL